MRMERTQSSANARVVYIGTGRQLRSGFFGRIGLDEDERIWRQRLAQEMEEAMQEMGRRGLCLQKVVPVLRTAGMTGSWTEGAWLFFSKP